MLVTKNELIILKTFIKGDQLRVSFMHNKTPFEHLFSLNSYTEFAAKENYDCWEQPTFALALVDYVKCELKDNEFTCCFLVMEINNSEVLPLINLN